MTLTIGVYVQKSLERQVAVGEHQQLPAYRSGLAREMHRLGCQRVPWTAAVQGESFSLNIRGTGRHPDPKDTKPCY
ncbi:MAG: hypothetical protein RBS80_17095 [Thermoguttaceae bacterium]|jgi:hypothetical protein|nr:hypothetical protein [Thermoguttaceae bacterium]